MTEVLSWFFPSDPIALTVIAGVVILSAVAALVGCFTLLRKRALAGDAIAHAVLPGICLAFLITGEKSMLWFMGGAVLTGWMSLVAIDAITTRTRLKADAATGLVLSTFFGFGVVLLTVIQHSGAGNQSGIDRFLFGRAAAMTSDDVWLVGILAIVIVGIIALHFRRFSVLSFDPEFAASIGMRRSWLSFLLAMLTVAVVAIGIQAVGVVLMAALLVTPAAAARAWTERLSVMALMAIGIGALSGWLGAGVSTGMRGMPTGPWVVLVASALAGISFLFAPQRGLLSRWLRSRSFQRKVEEENLLKAFFSIGHDTGPESRGVSLRTLRTISSGNNSELQRVLLRLRRRSLVSSDDDGIWRLTSEGLATSERIVRLHRLWELYLNKRLGLPPDHVHHSAEAMEHVLTPELEGLLNSDLGNPGRDPHHKPIPGPHNSKTTGT